MACLDDFVNESERREIDRICERWSRVVDFIESKAEYTIEIGQDLGLEPPDASDYLM